MIDKGEITMKNKDIMICTGILNAILPLILVSMLIIALLYCTCTINQYQAIVYLIIICIIFVIVLVMYNKLDSIQEKRK